MHFTFGYWVYMWANKWKEGISCGGYCWNYSPGTLLSLSSHCNLLEDGVPLDEICGFPNFKSVAMTQINTLRRRQNGRLFADDIFISIFLNENVWILINISLKFVPKGQIDNISALVQKMAWHGPGDRPLFEPKIVRLLSHLYMRNSASVSWR